MKKIIRTEDFEVFFARGIYYVEDFADSKIIQLKPVDGTAEPYDYSGKNAYGNNLYFAKDTKTVVTVTVGYDEVNRGCDIELVKNDRAQEDSVSEAFVFDGTTHSKYLTYLLGWVMENSVPTSAGLSPDSYDDWIKN